MSFCCTGFRSEHIPCVDCGIAVFDSSYTLYDPVLKYHRALCHECYDARQPKP